MPAISVARVIDAARDFVLETDKSRIDYISGYYIVSPKYDYFPDYVGLFITSCIVSFKTYDGVYDSVSVYVGTDGDLNCVMTFQTPEEQGKFSNEYLGNRAYVYSNISQKNVINNIDKSVDNLVLRASPCRKTIPKTVRHHHKPDFRRKCAYTWTDTKIFIPYYKLTIYRQIVSPNYSSVSYYEMDELFDLLEC